MDYNDTPQSTKRGETKTAEQQSKAKFLGNFVTDYSSIIFWNSLTGAGDTKIAWVKHNKPNGGLGTGQLVPYPLILIVILRFCKLN